MSEPIPIIVLAGSDHQPVQLPKEGSDKRPLVGAKGIDLLIGGRPLITVVIERLLRVGAFGPIFVAGPARLYRDVVEGAELIDTDGTFGENVEAATDSVRRRFPDSAVALTTCDILPDVEEFRRVMDDYARNRPLDFWYPVATVPEDPRALGASSWKPRYHLVADERDEPVPTLPSHIIVVRLSGLRIRLVYQAFALAYESRNRPVIHRMWLLLRHVLPHLLWTDLRNLFYLRPPTVTVTVARNAIALGFRLKNRVITQHEVEERLDRIFIQRLHRKRRPERRGRIAVVDGILSLAKDFDTLEEARERGVAPMDPSVVVDGSGGGGD